MKGNMDICMARGSPLQGVLGDCTKRWQDSYCQKRPMAWRWSLWWWWGWWWWWWMMMMIMMTTTNSKVMLKKKEEEEVNDVVSILVQMGSN